MKNGILKNSEANWIRLHRSRGASGGRLFGELRFAESDCSPKILDFKAPAMKAGRNPSVGDQTVGSKTSRQKHSANTRDAKQQRSLKKLKKEEN